MSDITPEKIRQFLDLPLDQPNDSGETTARGYLLRLLAMVWHDGEGFNGKHPFGNSAWESDLHLPMIQAGLIDGRIDSDGYLDAVDRRQADALVSAAIAALDAPRDDAPGNEPAKVVIVTESHVDRTVERRYHADGWECGPGGGLDVRLSNRTADPVVAVYAPNAWLSVREGDALVPDGTKLALGIAKQALRGIGQMGGPDNIGDAKKRAHAALDEIYAETES